jgi:hypothetical protein
MSPSQGQPTSFDIYLFIMFIIIIYLLLTKAFEHARCFTAAPSRPGRFWDAQPTNPPSPPFSHPLIWPTYENLTFDFMHPPLLHVVAGVESVYIPYFIPVSEHWVPLPCLAMSTVTPAITEQLNLGRPVLYTTTHCGDPSVGKHQIKVHSRTWVIIDTHWRLSSDTLPWICICICRHGRQHLTLVIHQQPLPSH